MEEGKKECLYCYSVIDKRATVCPQCHRNIGSKKASLPAESTLDDRVVERAKEPKRRKWGWFVIVAVFGIAVGACGIFALTRSLSQSPTDFTNSSPTEMIVLSIVSGAEGMIVPVRYADLSFPDDRIVSEVLVEEGDNIEAGATLVLSEESTMVSGLAQVEVQLTEAEVMLDLAQNRLEILGNSEPEPDNSSRQQTLDEAITETQSSVDLVQDAVAAARQTLDYGALDAPFAGTVAEIHLQEGETALSGAPIITVADFSNWLVKTTDLSELSVAGIAVGDSVDVVVDAIPGEFIKGEVADIATISNLERGDVLYEVTIELDETDDLPLRWGMTVAVEIESN